MDTPVTFFSVAAGPTKERNLEIYKFSDEVAHIPGKCRAHMCKVMGEFYFRGIITLLIYPNGKNIENKGYVSVFIEISDTSLLSRLSPLLVFSCVISVKDISGYQRFPQSLSIPHRCPQIGKEVLFGFDKFVARETLLSEKSALLPDDTLTIHLHCNILERIHNESHLFLQAENHLDSSFEEFVGRPGEDRGKLLLDSVLVQILSKFSKYFQRLLVTPMKEKQNAYIKISKSEFKHLKTFGLMIMRQCYRSLDVYDVCAMYAIAHKYSIDIIFEKCKEFMKRILSLENYREILDIAYECDDSYLREIVLNFLRTKHDGEGEAGKKEIEIYFDESGRLNKLFEPRYVLRIEESIEEFGYDENPGFDFYK